MSSARRAAGTPRVSWLIPVYNAERYLRAALKSVREQTFTDFEAVIVDDGSVDGSAAIIDEICAEDSRFTYVRQRNAGVTASLNAGLALCRGELVARMDADDLCEVNRLQLQVAFLNNHPRCIVAGSRTTVIDELGTIVRHSKTTAWRQAGPRGFPPRTLSLTHPTVLARADAIRAQGGYRPQFPAAEDYDLWIRLSRVGEIVEMRERLLRYRVHAKSESAVKIFEQRLSSVKAEIADCLSRTDAGPADIAAVVDSASLEELCCACSRIDRGLPRPEMLALYFSSECLRRATYRLPRNQALALARETLLRMARLTPRADARALHFLIGGARELARWALVNVTSRNAQTAPRGPLANLFLRR